MKKLSHGESFYNIEEMDFSWLTTIKTNDTTGVYAKDGSIIIENRGVITMIFDMQGRMIYYGSDNIIPNLKKGFYIVKSGDLSIKVEI